MEVCRRFLETADDLLQRNFRVLRQRIGRRANFDRHGENFVQLRAAHLRRPDRAAIARGEADHLERPPFFHVERARKIVLERRVKRRLPVVTARQPRQQCAQFRRAVFQGEQIVHEHLRAGVIRAAVLAVQLRVGRPAQLVERQRRPVAQNPPRLAERVPAAPRSDGPALQHVVHELAGGGQDQRAGTGGRRRLRQAVGQPRREFRRNGRRAGRRGWKIPAAARRKARAETASAASRPAVPRGNSSRWNTAGK